MRLIDADYAKDALHYIPWIDYSATDRVIDETPTIDAVPVVHGRWDDSGRYKFWDGSKAIRCSVCGACLTEEDVDRFEWFYCPICGAKMDEEAEHETD